MDPAVIAGGLTAFATIAAGLITLYGELRKSRKHLNRIQDHTETNGSGKPLGLLVEITAEELMDMKRMLQAHITDPDAHEQPKRSQIDSATRYHRG